MISDLGHFYLLLYSGAYAYAYIKNIFIDCIGTMQRYDHDDRIPHGLLNRDYPGEESYLSISSMVETVLKLPECVEMISFITGSSK